jgi:uncharacterized protein YutE (UPF0331/DUF86 family)
MTPGRIDLKIVRNRLTHHYDEVTPRELFEIITGHLDELEAIAETLRSAASRLAR